MLVQNKLTAQGLLEAKNDAAKLGQVSGIDALVYGTITTLGEDIRISISIVKLPTLAVFGYAKSSFSLTNGLKEMLPCIESADRTIIGGNGTNSSQTIQNQDLSNALMGDKSIEIKKEACTDTYYYYGQICLENIMKQPLVLYQVSNGPTSNHYYPNMLIGTQTRNCTENLRVAGKTLTERSLSYTLYFHTAEEDESKRLYGKMTVDAEACKVKVRVINSQRLYLSKTKPD